MSGGFGCGTSVHTTGNYNQSTHADTTISMGFGAVPLLMLVLVQGQMTVCCAALIASAAENVKKWSNCLYSTTGLSWQNIYILRRDFGYRLCCRYSSFKHFVILLFKRSSVLLCYFAWLIQTRLLEVFVINEKLCSNQFALCGFFEKNLTTVWCIHVPR